MAQGFCLEIYRDLATDTVYVLAGRDKYGVHLRDLDSEPGDPAGVVVVGEWEFWAAKTQGRITSVPID